MKPSVLIAAGCSWVAGRAIDTDPTATTLDFDHVEDPAFVAEHSFAGKLQQLLGLDQIKFIACNGSNNDTQFANTIEFIDTNYDNYSKIFVLWGLTSIYRWEMFSNSTQRIENCMVGKEYKREDLSKEIKYYFSHHWDKHYELKKLGLKVTSMNGYLEHLNIDHLFFNAFQSYNNTDLKIRGVKEKNFYYVKEQSNDLLNFLCSHNNIKADNKPWLNLFGRQQVSFNNSAVTELQSGGWLDQATAHPTVKSHSLIAEELYKYIIKEKTNERI
jgi:hypothetical protein